MRKFVFKIVTSRVHPSRWVVDDLHQPMARADANCHVPKHLWALVFLGSSDELSVANNQTFISPLHPPLPSFPLLSLNGGLGELHLGPPWVRIPRNCACYAACAPRHHVVQQQQSIRRAFAAATLPRSARPAATHAWVPAHPQPLSSRPRTPGAWPVCWRASPGGCAGTSRWPGHPCANALWHWEHAALESLRSVLQPSSCYERVEAAVWLLVYDVVHREPGAGAAGDRGAGQGRGCDVRPTGASAKQD